MTLLSVRDLEIDYRRRGEAIRAVNRVSFELEAGKTLGLVGESGSGKTTLALSLMGLLPPSGVISGGTIELGGREISHLTESQWEQIRWTRIALIFQGGMNALNPVQRVIDQIIEPIRAHDRAATKPTARARAKELLALVGIPRDRADSFPHEYSGGMRQRAGIAMALACSPALLIADEPVTALDVVVQAQIMQLLSDLQASFGLALLLITHDLGVVARLCEDVVVMYAAEVVEAGTAKEVFHDAKHPYSWLLLESMPKLGRSREVGQGVPGSPPSLAYPPAGCRFHPRCPHVMPICSTERPPLHRFSDRHTATCYLYEP